MYDLWKDELIIKPKLMDEEEEAKKEKDEKSRDSVPK